jgi:hypothetical protein
MTHNIEPIAKAMTAIAALLAFSSTPLMAQDSAPPDPATEASSETTAPADPLAAEPAAAEPAATELAPPPAPRPKVETGTKKTASAAPTASRSPVRPTARRMSAAAPAATAPAAVAAQPAAPDVPAAELPPVAAEPMEPTPVAEPTAAAGGSETLSSSLVANDMLPIAGGAALALVALGGIGLAARRRRRRREDEELEARQQALAMIDDEPTLELGQADEVRPAPAFRQAPAPVHDPVPGNSGAGASRSGDHVAATVPARGNWESRPDADFLFRRAGERRPVEQD